MDIRWMIRRDLSEVLAIENASFDYPWGEDELLQKLRMRNCIGMVAKSPDEEVLGFMVYLFKKSDLSLLNFAVAPDVRRSGVGAAMVNKLIDKLSPQRRIKICLTIRETNVAGQLFFRSQGFLATEIIPENYHDTNEDAYAMNYTVNDAPRGERTHQHIRRDIDRD